MVRLYVARQKTLQRGNVARHSPRYRRSVAALAVAFTVSPVAAVTGGQPDNGAHPQVAFIMAPAPGGGFYFCSGSLIAPRVVLTAGHCTALFSALRIRQVFVAFDEEVTADSTFSSARRWRTHPGYVDADWPFTVDVGVVILNQSVDLPLASLPAPGLLGARQRQRRRLRWSHLPRRQLHAGRRPHRGYRLGFDGALCGRLSSLNHRLDTPTVLDWLAQFL